MTLTELVTDLATSQQLKVAGFPQDTAMVWAIPRESWAEKIVPYVIPNYKRDEVCLEYSFCAAPTAEEILKELPPAHNRMFRSVIYAPCDGEPDWIVRTKLGDSGGDGRNPFLVLAAALAYLWWKKEVAGPRNAPGAKCFLELLGT